MISKIYLVRHGLTEGNTKRWFYGSTDVPLIPKGIAELEKYRDADVYPVIPAGSPVYTSELIRTEQTLQTIFGDLPHVKMPEFNEFNFGKYERATIDTVKGDQEFIACVKDRTGKLRFGGSGDSTETFEARVREGIRFMLDRHREHEELCRREGRPEAVSLAVIHGGVISQIIRQMFPEAGGDRYRWVPDPGLGYTVFAEDGVPSGFEPFRLPDSTIDISPV